MILQSLESIRLKFLKNSIILNHLAFLTSLFHSYLYHIFSNLSIANVHQLLSITVSLIRNNLIFAQKSKLITIILMLLVHIRSMSVLIDLVDKH